MKKTLCGSCCGANVDVIEGAVVVVDDAVISTETADAIDVAVVVDD